MGRTLVAEESRQDPREAFDRFYESYFPRVYGLMDRRSTRREETEEATRRVFLELIDCLDGLSEPEIKATLIQVIRRQLRGR